MPLDFDCFDKKQSKNQIEARVTTMVQSGILTVEMARTIIGMVRRGEVLTPEAIQDTVAKLRYKDLKAEERRQEKQRELDESRKLRAQDALSPRRGLRLE